MRALHIAILRPAFFCLLAALVFAVPARAQIENAPLLVADLDSGAVIFERNATGPWYPASLTKLMTTYVALDMVRQGRAGMNTLLTVSANAAAEPASKMGFAAGSQITLENALKIILVKSANDVATTIAENLGGSEAAFAELMTATARRIGMADSRFANAHGLPNRGNRTTARDMAILAQALWRDFPAARRLYGIQSIAYGNSVMNNHNGVIGRYRGATGMKTGYICSSGFNVVATASRGGRNLVTVVMGQMSSRERTALSASLLEHGFSARGLFGFASSRGTLQSLPRVGGEPPDLRPIVCDPNRRRSAGEDDNDVHEITIAGVASGGSEALAFFSAQSATLPVVDLPQRSAVEPEQVFLGLPAGSAAGPQVAAATTTAAAAPTPLLGAGLPLNIIPPRRAEPLIPGLPAATTQSTQTVLMPLPPRRPAGL